MSELDGKCDTTARRPWTAPQLTVLDISKTAIGASPNIEETALTDASLLSS